MRGAPSNIQHGQARPHPLNPVDVGIVVGIISVAVVAMVVMLC